MKFLSILAAASLALTPAIASAGSSGDNTANTDNTDNGRPISGPLAGRVLDDSEIPAGAIILGGLVLIGGAVVAFIGKNDTNNNTND